MVFNPLFLNVYTTTDPAESSKTNKFANQNYLFSDIIKVHFDKPADINQLLLKDVNLSDNKLNPKLLPSASIELSDAEIKDVKQILQNILGSLTGKKNLPGAKTFEDEDATVASNETEIVSGDVVLSLLNQLGQLSRSSGEASQISEINSVEFGKELEKLKAVIASSENENGCRVVVQIENKEYTLNIQPVKNLKKSVSQELAKIEELNKNPEVISSVQTNSNLINEGKINLPDNSGEAATAELNSTDIKNEEPLQNAVPVSGEENEKSKIALANKGNEQKPSTNAFQKNITEINFTNSSGTSSNTVKTSADENLVSSSPKVQLIDPSEIKTDNTANIYADNEKINTTGNSKLLGDDKINMSEEKAEGFTEALKNLSSAKNNILVGSQLRVADSQKNIKNFEMEKADINSVDAKEIKQTAQVEVKTNHSSTVTEAQTAKVNFTEKISANTFEPGIKSSDENSSSDIFNENEVKHVINKQPVSEVKKAAPQLFKIIVDSKQIENNGKDSAEIKIDIFSQHDENKKDSKNFLAGVKSLNNYEALKITKPQLVSRTHVSNVLSGQKSFESGYLKAIYTSSTYKNNAEFEPLNLSTTTENNPFTQPVVTQSNNVLQPELNTKLNMPVETINSDEVNIKAPADNIEIKNQPSDNKSAKTESVKLDFNEEIDLRPNSVVRASETASEKIASKSTVVDREVKQTIYQPEKHYIVETGTVNKSNKENLFRANNSSETTSAAEEKAADKNAVIGKLDELKTAAKVFAKHEMTNNIDKKTIHQDKNIGEVEGIKNQVTKDAQKSEQTAPEIKQTELEQKVEKIFSTEKLPLNIKTIGKVINANQMLNESDVINFNTDKKEPSLKNENEVKAKVQEQKVEAPIAKQEESVASKKGTVIQPEKEIKETKISSNNSVKEVTAVPRENTAQANVNNEKAASALANEKGEVKVSSEADTKSSGNELSNNDSKPNSYHQTEANKTTVTAEKTTFASHLNETVKTIKAAEVVKEITSFIKQGDKTSMTFKITPEHLGKVKVMLDVIENVVKANIEVESESVRQVVQNNIEVLKQSFIQSGIAVASININLAGQDQKSNRTYDQKKKIDTGDEEGKVVKNKVIDKKIRSLGYNTYEFLA